MAFCLSPLTPNRIALCQREGRGQFWEPAQSSRKPPPGQLPGRRAAGEQNDSPCAAALVSVSAPEPGSKTSEAVDAALWEPENRSLGHERRYSAPGRGSTANLRFQKSIFSPKPKWKKHTTDNYGIQGSPQQPCWGHLLGEGTVRQGCRGVGTAGSITHPGPRRPKPGTGAEPEAAESWWNVPEAACTLPSLHIKGDGC